MTGGGLAGMTTFYIIKYEFSTKCLDRYVCMNPVYWMTIVWICMVTSPKLHFYQPPLWCMFKLFTYLMLLLGVPTEFCLVHCMMGY